MFPKINGSKGNLIFKNGFFNHENILIFVVSKDIELFLKLWVSFKGYCIVSFLFTLYFSKEIIVFFYCVQLKFQTSHEDYIYIYISLIIKKIFKLYIYMNLFNQ